MVPGPGRAPLRQRVQDHACAVAKVGHDLLSLTFGIEEDNGEHDQARYEQSPFLAKAVEQQHDLNCTDRRHAREGSQH